LREVRRIDAATRPNPGFRRGPSRRGITTRGSVERVTLPRHESNEEDNRAEHKQQLHEPDHTMDPIKPWCAGRDEIPVRHTRHDDPREKLQPNKRDTTPLGLAIQPRIQSIHEVMIELQRNRRTAVGTPALGPITSGRSVWML